MKEPTTLAGSSNLQGAGIRLVLSSMLLPHMSKCESAHTGMGSVIGADVFVKTKGEPWFDDGNIVLLTYDSSVAFRLHRGVLARHSEIFQGMFEVPQPFSGYEVFEGCQVVRMHDLPIELSNLVKALYDGATFQNRNIEDFFYLAGILRLASKYFIMHLRTQAIRFLAQTWSYTLHGHDEMVKLALLAPLINDTTYPYVHPLHVLALARECDVRIIIPSVLYFLSLYPLSDLLRADHPKLMVDHPSRPASTLSAQDITDYSLMFQHRLDIILDFIRRFCGNREASPNCQNGKTPCSRVFARLSLRLSRTWMTRTGPFHYLIQTMNGLSDDATICDVCRNEFLDDTHVLREKLWQNLPSVLSLPSWEEMLAIDLPQ